MGQGSCFMGWGLWLRVEGLWSRDLDEVFTVQGFEFRF